MSYQELSKNCPKGSEYCSGSSEICSCWDKHRKETCEELKIKLNPITNAKRIRTKD